MIHDIALYIYKWEIGMDRRGNIDNWKKGHWEVNWSANRQCYEVFYRELLFAIEYKFSNVEHYLI